MYRGWKVPVTHLLCCVNFTSSLRQILTSVVCLWIHEFLYIYIYIFAEVLKLVIWEGKKEICSYFWGHTFSKKGHVKKIHSKENICVYNIPVCVCCLLNFVQIFYVNPRPFQRQCGSNIIRSSNFACMWQRILSI